MARSLNPNIFESRTPAAPAADPMMPEQKLLKEIESNDQLRRRVRELESQNVQLVQKIDKVSQMFEQKSIQQTQALKVLEERFKESLQELARQNAMLASKVSERKMADVKIQELVDRHNQLVQNFEVRLTGAQKISAEQERKLSGYQSTIDEILREIRLRKI